MPGFLMRHPAETYPGGGPPRTVIDIEPPRPLAWRDKWPIASVLFGAMFLQRFGITAGSFRLPMVLLIVIGVFCVLAVRRRAYLSKASFVRYLLFAICALAATCLTLVVPPKDVPTSMTSLVYFLGVYLFLVFRIRNPIGLLQTLAIFRQYALIVVVAACLQFGLQFAGLRLFSFRAFVPDVLLYEEGYNVVIPLWYGGLICKSNGFFMLEPSFFSQYAALGLVIEFLYFGNLLRMGVLVLGMLLSFSGSGMLVLAFAVVMVGFFERKAFKRLTKFLVIGGFVALVLGALAAPEYVTTITSRTTELGSNQSSGFIRFVSPYLALAHIMSDPRSVLGFGPGTAEKFTTVGYTYGINALTKVLIEYGVAALIAYWSLLMSVFYRADTRALSIVALFIFFVGGGYHLCPPIIYTFGALFAWGLAAPQRQGASQPSYAGPARSTAPPGFRQGPVPPNTFR